MVSNKASAKISLERALALSFANPALLEQALTHDSWRQDRFISKTETYQRLEFLGDSVINFLTVEFLYKKYPNETEGQLSKKKSAIVSGAALAKSARELKLSKYLNAADNVDKSSSVLLADIFEAVVGAVYLDLGLGKCRDILDKFLFSRESEILQSDIFKNPKTLLNEKAQALGLGTPIYSVEKEWGEEHLKQFKVSVSVGGKIMGEGEGFSKKEAEQVAAKIGISRFS